MNLEEMIQKVPSSEIPAVGLSVGALVVGWIAVKVARGVMKLIFVLVALALIGAALWWHFHLKP